MAPGLNWLKSQNRENKQKKALRSYSKPSRKYKANSTNLTTHQKGSVSLRASPALRQLVINNERIRS
jgi:hypothetical protein